MAKPTVIVSKGGHVQPKAPPGKKKVTKATVRPATPLVRSQTSKEAVDDAFRNIVAQIRAPRTADVIAAQSAAIQQPYTDAVGVSQGLDVGLTKALTDAGAAAQAQEAGFFDRAQQQSAAFGIGSGAGTSGIRTTDPGVGVIGQQTAAQLAAVPMASRAFAGRMGTLGAQAETKAELERQQGIDSTVNTLTAHLPDLYGAEDDRRLQRKTQADNNRFAYAQLDQKGKEAYRQAQLDKYGIDTRAATADEDRMSREGISAKELAQRKKHDADTVAHWNATETRLTQAAKAGKLQGLPQILAALKPPSTKSSKKQHGWYADVQQSDEAGVIPGTSKRVYFTTPTYDPPAGSGYALVPGSNPQPYYVTQAGTTAGFSWSRYKHAAALAKQLNPTLTPQEIRNLLGPTPKTSSKKKK